MRQWAERTHVTSSTQDQLGSDVWNGIRPLLDEYPRDRSLQVYLRKAITSGILPLHVFVNKLLTPPFIGAGVSELSTLDTLCQLALVTHIARNPGALIPKGVPLEETLQVARNAIRLVLLSFGTPTSPTFPHSLSTSAPDLLCLILDSLSDPSALPSSQAAALLQALGQLAPLTLSAPVVQRISDCTNSLTYATLHASDDLFAGMNLDMGPSAPQEPQQTINARDVICTVLLRQMVRCCTTSTAPCV